VRERERKRGRETEIRSRLEIDWSFFLLSAVCFAVVRVNDNGGCDTHAEL